MPSPAGVREAEGRCPYAAAFAAGVESGDAVAAVFAVTCDQMRRSAEDGDREGAGRFLFHVPSTWQTPAAHRYYRAELRRLGRFLERVGGRAPEPGRLASEMERFERLRERLAGLRDGMTSRAHAELTARFHAAGELPEADGDGSGNSRGGIPLLLLGSPLRTCDLGLLDAIDRAGGRVILDATESGEREWPRRFDRRRLGSDPLDELADAYFGHIPAVFRRPNTALFDWLAEARRTLPFRGTVLVTHPWCDLWRAELPRVRAVLDSPVLAVDLAGDGVPDGSWATRVQALLEMSA